MYSVAKVLNTITGSTFPETLREYKILCPFHRESTPSFRMDYTGRFVCFACGVHGSSLVSFLCQLYDIPDLDITGQTADALTLLASGDYSRVVPDGEMISHGQHTVSDEQIAANLAAAREYYHGNFSGDPSANKNYDCLTPGFLYLYNRGLVQETLHHFRVVDWQLFHEHPVFLPMAFNGECWGYQQRRIASSSWPKYLSMIGQKSTEHLDGYCPDGAWVCLVVEGPLDKMYAWQYGWRKQGCAAVLGSTVSKEQARLLSTCAPTLLSGFDMDAAGDKAHASLVEEMHPYGTRILRLSLDCQGISSATRRQFRDGMQRVFATREKSVTIFDTSCYITV